MPRFDYKCLKCDHEFEFFKLRSDETAECPECGAKGEDALEKLISKDTGFSLKGGGWYRDGYKGKKND